MLALLPMVVALIAGWRWPAFLIAGGIFTYQAAALSGIGAVSTLFAIAALLVALARGVRSGAFQHFRVNAVDLSLAAFLLVYAASVIYSPAAGDGISAVGALLLPALSMYGVGRLSTVSSGDSKTFGTTLAGAILGFGFVYAVLIDQNKAMALSGRLEIGNSNVVGIAQAFPLVLIAGTLALTSAAKARRWLLMTCCIIAVIAVARVSILAGTRGVYIAYAFGLLTWIAFAWKDRATRRVAATFSACALLAYVSPPQMLFGGSLAPSFNRLVKNFESGEFRIDLSGRLRLIKQEQALSLFQEHPLAGVGIGGYHAITNLGYPHNVFLEVGSELGLLGLALLFTYLATVAWRALLAPSNENQTRLLTLCLLATTLAHMQLSFSLPMAKPLFLLSGIVAGLATARRQNRTSASLGYASPRSA